MMKDFALDDDFESYAPGQAIIDFQTQINRGDVAAVSADTAAGGRQSLKFMEGPGPAQFPWAPHIYCFPRYKGGVVRSSFDLRVEPGANLNFEWRDWPEMGGAPYKPGPSLTVAEDGSLTAGGKKLLTLSHSQWTHFEIVCDLGAKGAGAYTMTVTLPGQALQRFDGLRCNKDFKVVDWVGFSSLGKPGTVFYVDNLKLSRSDR
ncbi:MAG: hypothetical protein NTX50_10685 [Candidatus Sumerlaeota bacterium]|nr:hypothetical protein [Candidatus Sumerlaeota bacterium]